MMDEGSDQVQAGSPDSCPACVPVDQGHERPSMGPAVPEQQGAAPWPFTCGTCGEALDPGVVHDLSEEEFRRLALEGPGPILVDFHATWCGPCKWLEPVLVRLSQEGEGRFLVARVDVDQAEDAARDYAIGSVPTVILFRQGAEVGRSLGVEPDRLAEMVRELPPRHPVPGLARRSTSGASHGSDSIQQEERRHE